jgi:hypothetical protein
MQPEVVQWSSERRRSSDNSEVRDQMVEEEVQKMIEMKVQKMVEEEVQEMVEVEVQEMVEVEAEEMAYAGGGAPAILDLRF